MNSNLKKNSRDWNRDFPVLFIRFILKCHCKNHKTNTLNTTQIPKDSSHPGTTAFQVKVNRCSVTVYGFLFSSHTVRTSVFSLVRVPPSEEVAFYISKFAAIRPHTSVYNRFPKNQHTETPSSFAIPISHVSSSLSPNEKARKGKAETGEGIKTHPPQRITCSVKSTSGITVSILFWTISCTSNTIMKSLSPLPPNLLLNSKEVIC